VSTVGPSWLAKKRCQGGTAMTRLVRLVMLASLILPLFALPSHVESAERRCRIPKDRPLRLEAEAGRQVRVKCRNDGTIRVTEEAITTADFVTADSGDSDNDLSTAEFETADNTPAFESGGGFDLAAIKRKTCVARSYTRDLPNLVLTYQETRIGYRYRDREFTILDVKGDMGWWGRTTENSRIAAGDWKKQAHRVWWGRTERTDGRWSSQRLEGWTDWYFYSETPGLNDGFEHGHDVGLEASGAGTCRGWDFYWGDIPPGGDHIFRVRHEPYY